MGKSNADIFRYLFYHDMVDGQLLHQDRFCIKCCDMKHRHTDRQTVLHVLIQICVVLCRGLSVTLALTSHQLYTTSHLKSTDYLKSSWSFQNVLSWLCSSKGNYFFILKISLIVLSCVYDLDANTKVVYTCVLYERISDFLNN